MFYIKKNFKKDYKLDFEYDATDTNFWKGEKRTMMISFKFSNDIGAKKYCFLNSHFETKYKDTKDEHFGHFKELRKKIDDKLNACDAWLWGGDFNFRMGADSDTVVNPAYLADGLADDFKKLNIKTDAVMTIGDIEKDLFEPLYDLKKLDYSLHDDGFPFYLPPYQYLPPSYSRTKEDKCKKVITVDGNINKDTKIKKEKSPVCFETKSGGNCDKPSKNDPIPNMYCLAGGRPPSWTDAIFSDGNHKIEKYGGFYGPTPSDHAPIFIVVDTDSKLLGNELEEKESNPALEEDLDFMLE